MFGFLNNIGPTEIVVILLIVVFLFGGSIARKIGRASGETYREIKNVKKTINDAVTNEEGDKK